MTDFTCPVRVIPGGAVEGKTLAAAGLRGLPGLFLTAVQAARRGRTQWRRRARRCCRRRAVFAGDAAGISSLRRIPGITAENQQVDKLKLHKTDRRLVQAVVAIGSPLTNRAIRDVRFRTCYDAVIIAVQRSGPDAIPRMMTSSSGRRRRLLDTSPQRERRQRQPAFAILSAVVHPAPLPGPCHPVFPAPSSSSRRLRRRRAGPLPRRDGDLVEIGRRPGADRRRARRTVCRRIDAITTIANRSSTVGPPWMLTLSTPSLLSLKKSAASGGFMPGAAPALMVLSSIASSLILPVGNNDARPTAKYRCRCPARLLHVGPADQMALVLMLADRPRRP